MEPLVKNALENLINKAVEFGGVAATIADSVSDEDKAVEFMLNSISGKMAAISATLRVILDHEFNSGGNTDKGRLFS